MYKNSSLNISDINIHKWFACVLPADGNSREDMGHQEDGTAAGFDSRKPKTERTTRKEKIMAKYKVGDKVRIVNHRTFLMSIEGKMDKWLGKTMTIRKVSADGIYSMEEDKHERYGKGWAWCDSMISGLAKPKFSVSVHFHDRLTVAELIKDGKVVKVENARCNPKDKYSMAEGARIAVERLFQKKVSEKPIHIGEKLIVTGNSHRPHHHFPKGTIVTAIGLSGRGYINCHSAGGLLQTVSPLDLKPYKEK